MIFLCLGRCVFLVLWCVIVDKMIVMSYYTYAFIDDMIFLVIVCLIKKGQGCGGWVFG